MTTITRSPTDRAAIRDGARRDLARLSFPDFLNSVQIHGDDPLHPVVSKWEPWPYLVEQAESWIGGGSEVILKDRQLGYSWLVAAYAVWRARSGWAAALISKGQLEARELLAKCTFIEEHLPTHLRERGHFLTDDMTYAGGGKIMAFPSTPDAGVSFTFQLVAMDEAAFHPYAGPNYAAIRATTSAGGQFIILSTADPELGSFGWFPEFYWESKKGETGYASRFVPWWLRPGRDAAWYERERRAYKGMPEHFDAYYANSDAEAFAGKSGLVFPMFSEQRHVRIAPWAWNDSVRKVCGVDFGGGDPTAASMLGMSGRQHVHQFSEFYKRGPVPVSEIAGFIAQWPGPGRVMCDPSEPVAIATLAQALVGTGWEVLAADNRRGEGLGMFAFLLENDRFSLEPTCRECIGEFPGYRWANRTDPNDRTRYATSTPVDNHADGKDSERYGILEITAMLHDAGVKMPTRTLGGRPLSRSAV